MKNLLLFCSFVIISFNVVHSEELTLYFKNLNRVSDDSPENTTPLYFLTFDTLRVRIDKIASHDKYIPLKLPNMLQSKDTTFFKLFFKGWVDTPFDRCTMFLVGNYKADSTFFWVDLNNNLDFTDDNAFYTISKENPEIYVPLYNQRIPEGKFVYKLRKKIFDDSTIMARVKEHYYNDNKENGFVTTEAEYWIGETRQNILSVDTIIDGKKVQMGIMDWNCNGLYNDIDTISEDNFESDRILVGNYGTNIISDKPSAGAVQMLPETLIPINGVFYLLTDIEPTGRFIKIKKTTKTYQILKPGDKLPDMEFTLIDGQETSLDMQIVKGKYNLIDFWGFWCKGCMLAIPKLKALDSLYSDKINIIGLHNSESSIKKAKSVIEKHNMTWTQGILTVEIEKKLLSSGGYPYYVLIDPDGKIYKFDTNLKEVEAILKK